MRLDNYICARYPDVSISEARNLIAEEKVSVNGRVVKEVAWNVVLQSEEERTFVVKGMKRPSTSEVFHRMILMHKPIKCISMRFKDEKEIAKTDIERVRNFKKKGIKSVYDVVPEELRHRSLNGFGRLDRDTTGLYIMGTDGGLNHLMMHSNNKCDKVYVADILAKPFSRLCEDAPERFAKGLVICCPQNPTKCLPAKLEVLETIKLPYHHAELKKKFGIVDLKGDVPVAPPCATRVRITIREGMYHQVKKMVRACGSKVVTLHRERVGMFSLLDYPEFEKPNSVLECTPDMMNRLSISGMIKIRTSSSSSRRRKHNETKGSSSSPKSNSTRSEKIRKRCD